MAIHLLLLEWPCELSADDPRCINFSGFMRSMLVVQGTLPFVLFGLVIRPIIVRQLVYFVLFSDLPIAFPEEIVDEGGVPMLNGGS